MPGAATPPTVEQVGRLRPSLDDSRIVVLTESISVQDLRSRTNSAPRLTGQGFTSRCELPPRGR